MAEQQHMKKNACSVAAKLNSCASIDHMLMLSLILSCKPYAIQLNPWIDNMWDVSVVLTLLATIISIYRDKLLISKKQIILILILVSYLIVYTTRTFFVNRDVYFGSVSESSRMMLLVVAVYCSGARGMRICIETVLTVFSIYLLLGLYGCAGKPGATDF